MFKTNKNKIMIVFVLMVLFLSFLSLGSIISSAGIVPVSSKIDIDWDEEAETPIVPRNEVRSLNLTVTYQAIRSGEFTEGIIDAYGLKQAIIGMEVVDNSPWCTANLQYTKVALKISDVPQIGRNYVNIQLDEDAPAFELGYVTIKASLGKLGLLPPFSTEVSLDFVPAYLPIIDANYPDGNSQEIGPDDTAIFSIDLENMGNARTRVFLELEDIPDGWTVVVTDDVTLGEESGSHGTAYVTVKPPKDFGYHEDRGIVTVSMLPARVESLSEKGEKIYASFIVYSKGVFTPGFETIIFLGALSLVFTTIIIKNKKIKKK